MPHAGEAAGPASVRGAVDVLLADRIRHGIGSVEDGGLLRELADRSIVCDVCPVSNLRTRVVASIESHPLPVMMAAGVLCSISTDDPAMFDSDLTRDYEVAAEAGCPPERAFHAGVVGALCDAETRSRLQRIARLVPVVRCHSSAGGVTGQRATAGRRPGPRRSRRQTNLSADHVSSMAQTLLSTSPRRSDHVCGRQHR